MGLEGVLQCLREGEWLGLCRFSLDTLHPDPRPGHGSRQSGVQPSAPPVGLCERLMALRAGEVTVLNNPSSACH